MELNQKEREMILRLCRPEPFRPTPEDLQVLKSLKEKEFINFNLKTGQASITAKGEKAYLGVLK